MSSSSELLDIFDENMTHLGVRSREEVHSLGLWHHTFHCWIVRQEGAVRYVLFQRRGPEKLLFPNMLDITAAGHLQAGEKPEDGLRELNEELGMSCVVSDLIPLGIRIDVSNTNNVTINHEFCHTYLVVSHRPLDAYKLQADEVSGLVQIELNDGLQLFNGDAQAVRASGFQVDEEGKRYPIDIRVTRDDFIPRPDRAYLKVFIMANRYLDGIPYLAV